MRRLPLLLACCATLTLMACANPGQPSNLASTPVPTPTPSTPADRPWTTIPTISEGMHEVGVDIQPGRYSSQTNIRGCTWHRLRANTGSASDVIDQGAPVPGVITTITIAPTDRFFYTKGCSVWLRRS